MFFNHSQYGRVAVKPPTEGGDPVKRFTISDVALIVSIIALLFTIFCEVILPRVS